MIVPGRLADIEHQLTAIGWRDLIVTLEGDRLLVKHTMSGARFEVETRLGSDVNKTLADEITDLSDVMFRAKSAIATTVAASPRLRDRR